MKFSLLAVVAASLTVLDLTQAQAPRNVIFDSCRKSQCPKDVCQRYFKLIIQPNGLAEDMIDTTLVPPDVWHETCHKSGNWCVKYDGSQDYVSFKYANLWFNFSKKVATRNWYLEGTICYRYTLQI